ncbi:DUF7573 domain-containing protein [Haloarcula marina]|uniref:DUF7573 domain-containing protein n=1 Tax=Haloarcula marina TaxID=2961574 RepID=UPI0020B8CC45|nr:hypothetical protein [Halomicroarcula marina]
MDEDASLDRFLGEEGDDPEREGRADGAESATGAATGEQPADETSTDEKPTGDTETADGIVPATTTYAWSPDGAACGACGTAVERRWRQDGDLVCPDCKEWDQA